MGKTTLTFPLMVVDLVVEKMTIKIPEGSERFSVEIENGQPHLDVSVDVTAKNEARIVRTFGPEHFEVVEGIFAGSFKVGAHNFPFLVFVEECLTK